jgi:hypothetical protein
MVKSLLRKLLSGKKIAEEPEKIKGLTIRAKLKSALSAIARPFRRKKSKITAMKSGTWRKPENLVAVGKTVDKVFEQAQELQLPPGRIYDIKVAERLLNKANFYGMPPKKQATMINHLMDRAATPELLAYLSNKRDKIVARIGRR